MSIVKKAIHAKESGDLHSALKYYKQLKYTIGTSAFDADIRKIENELSSFNVNTNASLQYFFDYLKVDQVYILNMASNPYRKLRIAKEMSRVGINKYEFINGVEGYCDLKARDLFLSYISRPNGTMPRSSHIDLTTQGIIKKNSTIGTFGYLLSQNNVFLKANSSTHKKICVFDDDMLFSEQANIILKLIVQSDLIPHDFKILHLGASEYSEVYPISDFSIHNPKLYKAIPHMTCGSFATIYDRTVFNEVLLGIDEFDGPFDNTVLGSIYQKYQDDCFVISPNVCLADVYDSSIRHGRNQVEHSKKMHWLFTEYGYKEYNKLHVVNIVVRDVSVAIKFIKNSATTDNLYVNIFYCTNDGIRPLHSSSSCIYLDSIKEYKHEFDLKYLNGEYNFSYRLPKSDLSLYWPSSISISLEKIYSILFKELYQRCDSEWPNEIPYHCFESNFELLTKTELASVIMSMARSFDLVKSSINSVIQQDYNNIEFILVIDSPSKGIDTNYIIEYVQSEIAKVSQFGKNISFKLIQHNKVRYGCGARNTGMYASSGEFISFIDDDDIYTQDRLSKTINFLKKPENDKFDSCYCGFSGLWSESEGNEEHRYRSGNLFFDMVALNYKLHFVHTGTMTYRATALFSILGFDEKYKRHQDIELNARYFLRYLTGCVNSIGMQFKPNKGNIKPTVIIDFDLILQIKKFLINDFSCYISSFDSDQSNIFFNNHADDVIALVPEGNSLTKETAVLILRSYFSY